VVAAAGLLAPAPPHRRRARLRPLRHERVQVQADVVAAAVAAAAAVVAGVSKIPTCAAAANTAAAAAAVVAADILNI
jgi:hypothetical protein